jgi:hypothetical protein
MDVAKSAVNDLTLKPSMGEMRSEYKKIFFCLENMKERLINTGFLDFVHRPEFYN